MDKKCKNLLKIMKRNLINGKIFYFLDENNILQILILSKLIY